jgi:hypothetical protein
MKPILIVQEGDKNEYKQRDRKKSVGYENNPCSTMGSWNVK